MRLREVKFEGNPKLAQPVGSKVCEETPKCDYNWNQVWSKIPWAEDYVCGVILKKGTFWLYGLTAASCILPGRSLKIVPFKKWGVYELVSTWKVKCWYFVACYISLDAELNCLISRISRIQIYVFGVRSGQVKVVRTFGVVKKMPKCRAGQNLQILRFPKIVQNFRGIPHILCTFFQNSSLAD